ncbi:hypothetical protein [Xanthomonas sacchari]|uniref:hypothetical protein n=1 Tax=Xanthomonas sacchari TaxID=56458 RepID=UPI00224DA14A|nr:hypothetical protein [Xanthomonas sacchari]MCW0370969.1 hypothetical protein [Xanthomonas sacchari]MCW0388514.1 hypothetical protein [Xanthomonas sacchari]MCW0395655.1 hypothetical protein [Xanthomonas sacchari]MCW0444827.1 hypothetical protein [Xanthomonas sacchari]MCW0447885.1 hypothetical protein [Xanthomonas sacchari]
MNTASENAANPHVDAHGDPVYRKNPHPTQAYRITMTIEGAPGPFGYVSGTAFYDMINHEQCTPIEPIEGVWSKSGESGIPIDFKKVDESTYVGTVYADGMVDENYYGKGVCRFALSGVGVTLRATGNRVETRFQPALFKGEVEKAASIATYFWKGGYPRDQMENYPDSGHRDPEKFKQELQRALFKITLSSTKEAP